MTCHCDAALDHFVWGGYCHTYTGEVLLLSPCCTLWKGVTVQPQDSQPSYAFPLLPLPGKNFLAFLGAPCNKSSIHLDWKIVFISFNLKNGFFLFLINNFLAAGVFTAFQELSLRLQWGRISHCCGLSIAEHHQAGGCHSYSAPGSADGTEKKVSSMR